MDFINSDCKLSQNIYVIDTNIFLNNPYILNIFDGELDLIIIPQKVIDELDGLKKNQKEKNNAYNSICSIDSKKNLKNIIISPSFTNELPIDLNKNQPDNIILSIALKYNSMLLTNDRGLKVKAEFLNLIVFDSIEIHEHKTKLIKPVDVILQKKLVVHIKENDIKSIKDIINNKNIDINYLDEFGITPLIYAVKFKRYEIVEILTKIDDINIDKVDTSKLNMTPFSYATQKKDIKMMDILYKHGAKVYLGVEGKNKGNTPLLIAAWDGCLDCIKYIIDTNQVSINSSDNNGFTALIKACIKGHKDIVEYLLSNKADIKIRDKKNKNALDYATEFNYTEIINLLKS